MADFVISNFFNSLVPTNENYLRKLICKSGKMAHAPLLHPHIRCVAAEAFALIASLGSVGNAITHMAVGLKHSIVYLSHKEFKEAAKALGKGLLNAMRDVAFCICSLALVVLGLLSLGTALQLFAKQWPFEKEFNACLSKIEEFELELEEQADPEKIKHLHNNLEQQRQRYEALRKEKSDFERVEYPPLLPLSDKAALREAITKAFIEGSSFQELRVSSTIVHSVCQELFSERLIKEAMEFHRIDDKVIIDGQTLGMLLVCCQANITKSDFAQIWSHSALKDSFIADEKLITPPVSITELSEEQRCNFLNWLKKPLACEIELKLPKKKRTVKQGNFSQAYDDIAFLKGCRSYADFQWEDTKKNPLQVKFARSEFLSREFIYDLFSNGKRRFSENDILFISPGKQGPTIYETHSLYGGHKDGQEQTAGLYCAAIMPAYQRDPHVSEVEILFRGTYCLSSMVWRDFGEATWFLPQRVLGLIGTEVKGPGIDTFNKGLDTLGQRLLTLLEQHSKEGAPKLLKMGVHGHSLGAGDSKRFCAALVNTLGLQPSSASQNRYLGSMKLCKLKNYGWAAPVVEQSLVTNFHKHLKDCSFDGHKEYQQIKAQRNPGKAATAAERKTIALWDLNTKGDLVPNYGAVNLGYSNCKIEEFSPHLKVGRLLARMDKKTSKSTLHTHFIMSKRHQSAPPKSLVTIATVDTFGSGLAERYWRSIGWQDYKSNAREEFEKMKEIQKRDSRQNTCIEDFIGKKSQVLKNFGERVPPV